VRGHLAWAGDVDVLCAAEDAGPVDVVLDGVPGLDVFLRVGERGGFGVKLIDDGRVGEGERASLDAIGGGRTCVEIGVATEAERRANGEDAWVLHVRPQAP